MKIQHLAIIFIIIILPIALVVGEYIQAQIDTITMQTQYSKRLQDSTYDAMRAFQINTVNNKYSSLSDSKIRDIEASVNAFYNSLGTAMGASGYDKNELKEYIPAMVYTMYDGYYIYGKYFNYDNNQYQYGLKPYIYYACRYVSGSNDFVINYTLDNSITVYGYMMINGRKEYVTRSGYIIDPSLVSGVSKDPNGYGESVIYDGLRIDREILKEQVVIVEDNGTFSKDTYQYVKYNNQKIYKDNVPDSDGNIQYFTLSNNRRQAVSDKGKVLAENEITPFIYADSMTDKNTGNLYSSSAVDYYIKAQEFSQWCKDNLRVSMTDAVDNYGRKIQNNKLRDKDGNIVSNNGHELDYFATNTGSEGIFDFGNNNNPLVEGSTFNEHRMSVIRRTIETNLSSAIANYNAGSAGTYEFEMPIFNEVDWEKLLNNVSVSVFMQGVPMKSKVFNSYCIITNDRNEEVVTKDSIYMIATNGNGVTEVHLPGCMNLVDSNNINVQGYNVVDFHLQTAVQTEGDERYFYPQPYTRCYNCIVNTSKNYDVDSIIEGRLRIFNSGTGKFESSNMDIRLIRTQYLTALGRERYDLYRSNGNIYTSD